MKRLYNLDYLRGLAAFGIMIYHYMTDAYGQYGTDTFLGRLGMYGVSVFYVLSGLTLYLVYHTKMKPSKTDLLAFAKKRFFRIFPLLWLATIAAIVLSRHAPDLLKLGLNLSGLFGLFSWNNAFATGAWSIGNELVFYLFFPVFIFLMNKSKIGLAICSFIITGIYLYFAFVILDRNIPLADQWRNYVNPLNQVFLFLGGFLIGMLFKNTSINRTINLIILFGGLALFIFYPASGDKNVLATGFTRIVFTICCFMVCFGFYKTTIKFPGIINKPLTLLGEASYSVYLLHPIIYTLLNYFFVFSAAHFFNFPVAFKLAVSIIVTLILSYLIYEKFEKYFMKLGQSKSLPVTKQTIPMGVSDTL